MRSCGILMHITSLPSHYGIGTMGKSAYNFVDFLKNAGQKYWQILPIGPTSYGDSPYQSFSSFAGNPLLIDLDLLIEEKLLKKSEIEKFDFGNDDTKVDYEKQFNGKYELLKIASERYFSENKISEFEAFCKKEEQWLTDYALFMSLKYDNEQKAWHKWEKPLVMRESWAIEQAKQKYAEDMKFWQFVQFVFENQYQKLKKYCNDKDIEIIGDLPIYAALDSACVWSNSEIFWLDNERKPIDVSGCPPDYFSKTGQLWGNPLYNWQILRNTGYNWWVRRINKQMERYDVLRIDHFRAFDTYYAIPFGSKTAEKGEWRIGPRGEFFDTIRFACGNIKVIAEDLGDLCQSVKDLLEWSGYSGLKVLQFAIAGESESTHMPHNHEKNYVVYTGTHDNDTTKGWIDSMSKEDLKFAKKYMTLNESEGYVWGIIRTAYESVADTAIVPMQDFLELGSEARMNTPSTLGGNWTWRIEAKDLSSSLAKRIYDLKKTYFR